MLNKTRLNFIRYFFYIFNISKKINKIGFYINEKHTLDHYLNIIEKLDKNKFDLIISNHLEKNINFMKIIANSYNYVFLDDVLYFKKYKILITHLGFCGDTYISNNFFNRLKILSLRIIKKFTGLYKNKKLYDFNLQKVVGSYNIKFMYGIDDGGTFYGKYNKVYDEFYCHGPSDAKNIRKYFNKPIFQMGYPKYDKFFENLNNYHLKKKIMDNFSCNIKLKTILWICTKSKNFSTIETYFEPMKKLSKKYNIIIRPHPLEIDMKSDDFNKKTYDISHSKYFKLSNDSNQIMSNLFLIADYVFCDYGGSIFSSVYLEKKILLMNSDDVKYDYLNSGFDFNSTSIKSRKLLPYVNQNNQENFEKLISKIDSKYEINRVKKAKKIYFGDPGDSNSILVAKKLLKTYKKIKQ